MPIKLLAITDDIRLPTGVGIQANKLLIGLQKSGLFQVSQIGGSLIPQSPKPVEVEGVKIYPTSDGYGNPNFLRLVMQKERPDITLMFSDPRFFHYIFNMDNEVRHYSKLILYHTWDNAPFPKYNVPWYNACDYVTTISKFSHELLESGGVKNTFIPHGYNPQDFYALKPDVVLQKRKEMLTKVNRANTDFIIFWNNRNIHRKRLSDVIQSFEYFYNRHPDSLLFINTNPFDAEGNDIVHLLRDNIFPQYLPLVFNFNKVKVEELNEFYNIADVSINISNSEGFGLCVGESLLTETPVICTRTGGMIEQMTDGKSTYGLLLKPAVKELFGVPGAPYIYRDFVSYDQVVAAFESVYAYATIFKEKGKQGREHIINNYNTKSTIEKWTSFLLEVHNTPSQFNRFRTDVV